MVEVLIRPLITTLKTHEHVLHNGVFKHWISSPRFPGGKGRATCTRSPSKCNGMVSFKSTPTIHQDWFLRSSIQKTWAVGINKLEDMICIV